MFDLSEFKVFPFVRQLDPLGRVVIPIDWRDFWSERFFLCRSGDKIVLFGRDQLELVEGAENCYPKAFDLLGRIVIPKSLRGSTTKWGIQAMKRGENLIIVLSRLNGSI